MRRTVFVLLVLSILPRRTSIAQQQPSTIPTDLAVALLDHGESASGNRSPKLVVGHPPAGIPGSLTSFDGAVVLGGIEYPQSAVIVLGFTRPPNQVALAIDKQLTARRWNPPPPPPSTYMEQGGFAASPGYYMTEWGANTYCSDSGVVNVSYAAAPAGGTYLKIQHNRDVERSMCAPRQMYGFDQGKQLKFPTLHPPPTMSQRGSGSAGGGDERSINGRLSGPLDLSDIMAHYLKQLDSAGWKTGKVTSTGDVAISLLEASDADGRTWRGAFIAWRVAPFEIEATIRMLRPGTR